jgi:hypothetical protein
MGTDNPRSVAEYVYARIKAKEASDTDLASMGITNIEDYDKDSLAWSVARAYRRLVKVWQFVEQEAERLIAEATLIRQINFEKKGSFISKCPSHLGQRLLCDGGMRQA